MPIKTILSLLISIFVLGAIGGLVLAGLNASRGRRTRPGILIFALAMVGAIILAPLNAGLVLVQPGEVGVVFRQTSSGDAALLEPLPTGLHWVVPFIDQVTLYYVGQQTVTMVGGGSTEYYNQAVGESVGSSAVRAITSDGQEIYLDVTVIYRIDAAQVNDVYRNWRQTYVEGFIVPVGRSEVRNAVVNYRAQELWGGGDGEDVGGRAVLEQQIIEEMAPQMSAQGFILTDVLIRNISFSQEFMDAIENRQVAEQEAQRAVYLVQQQEQEAERARVEAQGLADARVTEAEGEAQAILIQAQAEAEALRLINEQLSQNPSLIQWRYVDELGENVRIIIVPSNSPFLFDLETLMGQVGATQTTGGLEQETETTP
jgi:regulator of protease activity HflC (stomatin/prohibitin superfamily)